MFAMTIALEPGVASARVPARAMPAHHRPRALREIILLVVLFLGYRQIRYLSRNDTQRAFENADQVVSFERRLGLFVERGWQEAILDNRFVIEILNHYYVFVHFPATAAFAIWVLVRHPYAYRTLRTWLIGVTAAGLIVHVLYPLAPPRMLVHEGFVDTLDRFGPDIYPSDTDNSIANQFAAMPSLHFGWAVVLAFTFVFIKRTWRSSIALLHPAITFAAIVVTANHFVLDAIVAGGLVALVVAATHAHRQRAASRPTAVGRRVRSVAEVRPPRFASHSQHVGDAS